MNKLEFSKLENKEDMKIAFNQLKDDYHILFEEHFIKNTKKNKIRKTHTLDKKVYAEFQLYASCLGRSVSSLIEEHMRNVLKEMKKEK